MYVILLYFNPAVTPRSDQEKQSNQKILKTFPWILWIDLCGRAWGRHRFRENHGARAAIGSTREERGGAEEAGGGRNLAVLVRPGAVQATPHATTEVRGVLRASFSRTPVPRPPPGGGLCPRNAKLRSSVGQGCGAGRQSARGEPAQLQHHRSHRPREVNDCGQTSAGYWDGGGPGYASPVPGQYGHREGERDHD